MISPAIQKALNLQVKKEFDSAYLYLSMSFYCESIKMCGCAHWLKIQWQEEIAHGMKLLEFINNREARVFLDTIEKPRHDWESVLEIFQQAHEHEKLVTQMIYELYAKAANENDYATQVALQWFVTEQIEEEKMAGDIVTDLVRVGDDPTGLLLVDQKLNERANVMEESVSG